MRKTCLRSSAKSVLTVKGLQNQGYYRLVNKILLITWQISLIVLKGKREISHGDAAAAEHNFNGWNWPSPTELRHRASEKSSSWLTRFFKQLQCHCKKGVSFQWTHLLRTRHNRVRQVTTHHVGTMAFLFPLQFWMTCFCVLKNKDKLIPLWWHFKTYSSSFER